MKQDLVLKDLEGAFGAMEALSPPDARPRGVDPHGPGAVDDSAYGSPGDELEEEEEEVILPKIDALDWSPPAAAVQGKDGRKYHDRTFFVLAVSDWPRKPCIQLVESWYFEPFILTVIICNVITMAWNSPLDPPGTSKAAFLAVRITSCASPSGACARVHLRELNIHA